VKALDARSFLFYPESKRGVSFQQEGAMKLLKHLWVMLLAVLVVGVVSLVLAGCTYGEHAEHHRTGVEHPTAPEHPTDGEHPTGTEHPTGGEHPSDVEHPH
jgi:hypothetical protein